MEDVEDDNDDVNDKDKYGVNAHYEEYGDVLSLPGYQKPDGDDEEYAVEGFEGVSAAWLSEARGPR